MKKGPLKWRVRFERATETTSGRGTAVKHWHTLRTVQAGRLQQRPTEAWRAGGTAAELETTWFTGWTAPLSDLSPRDRLRFPATDAGTVYEILGVTEIGRREGLEIVTKALA